MVCDICGEQDALIHVQQIMGGEVLDIHLCTDCAREKGIPGEDDNEDRLSLNNLLSGIVENFIGMQGKNTLPVYGEKIGNCRLRSGFFVRRLPVDSASLFFPARAYGNV